MKLSECLLTLSSVWFYFPGVLAKGCEFQGVKDFKFRFHFTEV